MCNHETHYVHKMDFSIVDAFSGHFTNIFNEIWIVYVEVTWNVTT